MQKLENLGYLVVENGFLEIMVIDNLSEIWLLLPDLLPLVRFLQSISKSRNEIFTGAVLYRVMVKTGTIRGAGTDANVYLTLFGEKGDSGKRLLDNSSNNFERGKTDEFGIECFDIGALKSAIIEHDNTGIGPGWFLDEVKKISIIFFQFN
jgi:hypothetical protein